MRNIRTGFTTRLVVVVALALAAPLSSAQGTETSPYRGAKVDWLTYGFDQQRTGYNPAETTLGVGNAANLHLLWSIRMGSYVETSPVVATDVMVSGSPRDLIYAGDEHGNFVAADANTGQIIWSRNLGSVTTGCPSLPDQIFGVTSAAAIDRTAGVVYEAGGNGKLYALDLATGTDRPGWPVTFTTDPQHEHAWSAVTVFQGRVYVELAGMCDILPYHGRVVSFRGADARKGPIFWVTGQDGPNGGGIWGWAGASVDPANGDVYVATGNSFVVQNQHYAYAEHVVRLSPRLQVKDSNYPGLSGPDVDFGSTPVLYQPPGCPPSLVTENKSGWLFVYNRDAISPGPTQSIRLSRQPLIGVPAYDPVTNMVYVTNYSDSPDGVYTHGLVALKVQEDCRLELAWQQPRGPDMMTASDPTVANGVVYYGHGSYGRAFAFDAATGQELWSSGATITGAIYGAPIVVNGKLYIPSWDKHLYAFGP